MKSKPPKRRGEKKTSSSRSQLKTNFESRETKTTTKLGKLAGTSVIELGKRAAHKVLDYEANDLQPGLKSDQKTNSSSYGLINTLINKGIEGLYRRPN
jgi:hypothetical protein